MERVELVLGAIAGGIAVCALVMLARWAGRWRRIGGAGGVGGRAGCGVCGQCGYGIAAGARVICSECGGDLRDVGLLLGSPREHRRELPPLAWGPLYLAAVLVSAGAALLLADPLARRLPVGWAFDASAWLDTGWGPQPGREAVLLYVRARGDWDLGRARATWVSVEGLRSDTNLRGPAMRVWPESRTCRVSDGSGRTLWEGPLSDDGARTLVDAWADRGVIRRDAAVVARDVEHKARALAEGRLPDWRVWSDAESVTYAQKEWVVAATWLAMAAALAGSAMWALRRWELARIARRRRWWAKNAAVLGLVKG